MNMRELKSKPDLEIIPLDREPFIVRRLREVAMWAKCKRSKCGAVIVSKDGRIIGEGYNSQPCDVEGECFKDSLPANFKSDKTCCIHAEARAINSALRFRGSEIDGSTLYFMRLNDNDEPESCGEPYCTMCSKLALDVGISRFALYHADGFRSYDTNHYNKLSFQYKK